MQLDQQTTTPRTPAKNAYVLALTGAVMVQDANGGVIVITPELAERISAMILYAASDARHIVDNLPCLDGVELNTVTLQMVN